MKKIIALILFAAMLFAAPLCVYAKIEESDTFYLDNVMDIVIAVSWDKEKPTIVFIDPDGTEYDPTKTIEGTSVVESETDLYYIIEEALPGQWRVRYDKGANTNIDVELHEYIKNALAIESFTLGTVDGTKLPVTFKVTGDDGVYYDYRISAMIDHTGSEKIVADGGAHVGDEMEVEADLSDLTSYSSYLLKLYVWYDNNGTDIFDFAYSSTFEYKNEEIDDRAEEFKMTVCPEDQLVYIGFTDERHDYESVLVAIFEDQGTEPISYDEYDNDKNEVQLSYDPAAKEVSVEVSYKYNGTYTTPLRKTAAVADMTITVPEGDSFNSVSLPMTYKGLKKQLCAVTVNDYTTELLLDGDGQSSITLGDDWNTLRIEYLDDNGVTWLIDKQIYVDRIPPALKMSQDYDGMAVSKNEIAISGTVFDCESLQINGTDVSFDAGGGFSHDIKLEKGENHISVVAKDKLGNETRYNATVSCGVVNVKETNTDSSVPGARLEKLLSPGSLYVLIGTSAVAVLIIGYALIFWRKEKGKDKPEKKEKMVKQKPEKKNKKADKKSKKNGVDTDK